MATKTTTFTLTANTLTTQAQSTATITGRTVYGDVVDVTETITQPGYVPPSTGAQITFTTEPIYLVNLCDDDILFEKVEIRVTAGGNNYNLTYVNPDYGEPNSAINPNEEVPLQLDGTPPTSLIQSSPITASITYMRVYTWDKYGDDYGITNDELVELTGPNVDGSTFTVDISGIQSGSSIEYVQSEGLGTVSLGGEGLIFNTDYETYLTIQHNFNS